MTSKDKAKTSVSETGQIRAWNREEDSGRDRMLTAIRTIQPWLKHGRGLGSASSATDSPSVPGRQPQAYYNPANFNTNVVIVMAAFLCILICALGISSVIRCALRCTQWMLFESREEAAVRRSNTGMNKRVVNALPTVVYGKSDLETGVPSGSECPICLGEFANGETVRFLPSCHHGFHVKCIDTWLASHSSCPTCRHSLRSITQRKCGVIKIDAAAVPAGMTTESVASCVGSRQDESGVSDTERFSAPTGGPGDGHGLVSTGCGVDDHGCNTLLSSNQTGISDFPEDAAVASTSQK